jgi:hypothetical protein
MAQPAKIAAGHVIYRKTKGFRSPCKVHQVNHVSSAFPASDRGSADLGMFGEAGLAELQRLADAFEPQSHKALMLGFCGVNHARMIRTGRENALSV